MANPAVFTACTASRADLNLLYEQAAETAGSIGTGQKLGAPAKALHRSVSASTWAQQRAEERAPAPVTAAAGLAAISEDNEPGHVSLCNCNSHLQVSHRMLLGMHGCLLTDLHVDPKPCLSLIGRLKPCLRTTNSTGAVNKAGLPFAWKLHAHLLAPT